MKFFYILHLNKNLIVFKPFYYQFNLFWLLGAKSTSWQIQFSLFLHLSCNAILKYDFPSLILLYISLLLQS